MYNGFTLLVEKTNKKDNTKESIKIIEKIKSNNKTQCFYSARDALQHYCFGRDRYKWLEGLIYSFSTYLQTNYNYPKQKNIEYEDENYVYFLRVILIEG